MNRLIQTARIADEMGNTVARDKMIATVKERLQDWLKAERGKVAFLFYYNTAWTAMLGYPAGHGQDNNINDHRFHWGYFIHAAAFASLNINSLCLLVSWGLCGILLFLLFGVDSSFKQPHF